ncbi:m7GpppN-mRNA hydrolase [Anopheles marshallii]|uniref:m7GpppN-mRNA hydrolase n=1 Tax=Anopheles marshallii TaxID=1521116 RepID=UPI00237B5240|nr:m7GpppN-mRNA hydrolase [Anopheles marshallii]
MATNSPVSVIPPGTASGQKGKQNGSLIMDRDIMDDLASRFIINVPEEERKNLIRICFQMELAHWFYLDFYCAESKHKCGIKQFAQQMFKHVPFLQPHWPNVDTVLEDWKQYKLTVPTYGAILLSEDMKHVLLVQSFWAKSSWGFPKGKINENEEPANCAIREVYEETGYDISKLIVPTEYIDVIINYQFTRLYLVPGVPLTTVFMPKTRNEIKCCEWFPVDVLPVTKHDNIVKGNHNLSGNSFFMILPFVKRLKKWLESYHTGKGGKGAIGKGSVNVLANNSPVFGRESAGKQKMNNHQQTQQGQKQRQRHKSMGELEQQPQLQLWQPGGSKGKGNIGTPKAHQQFDNSSANRSQQQQQKQTIRDDPNRTQRATSVVNDTYKDFLAGVADESSAVKPTGHQLNQSNKNETKSESTTSQSAANANGSRSERVAKSQTKRKLFANDTAPEKPTEVQQAESEEEDMDEFIDYLIRESKYDQLRNIYQWKTFQLSHSPFFFQMLKTANRK